MSLCGTKSHDSTLLRPGFVGLGIGAASYIPQVSGKLKLQLGMDVSCPEHVEWFVREARVLY